MKSPYDGVLEKMLQQMTAAMQISVKSNMEIYEAYQQQFRKFMESQAEMMAKVSPSLMDTFKEETERFHSALRQTASEVK